MATESPDPYDVALAITDEVFGDGAYAEQNERHPDPGVQAAIARWRSSKENGRRSRVMEESQWRNQKP